MPIDTKILLAQSEVRLFGWVVGEVASQMFGAASEPYARGGTELRENAGPEFVAEGQEHAEPQQNPVQFAFGLVTEGGPGAHAAAARLARGQEQDTSVRGPQLATVLDADLWLANVQAFSYEGRYVPFRAPALFLVHWEGDRVHGEDGHVDPRRLGLANLDSNMVFASDLRIWTYDRSFPIVRLDVSAGTLQRVVIDLETGGAHGRRIDLVGQEGSYTARLGQGNH